MTRRKMATIRGNRAHGFGGQRSVSAWRSPVLLIAGIAGLIALQPVRVSAQWWSHEPKDFEECADAAEKLTSKEQKTAALAECNAKFAGRRKPGGGYTYYDFMQDRTFDIGGSNPTREEQKYIDEQYTIYLEDQKRSSIAAALSAKQQQQQQEQEQERQVQQTSLRTETERVPIPRERPAKLRGTNCPQHNFSCEWPKLSESLKKLFTSQSAKAAN
jgi:hypothetical protein